MWRNLPLGDPSDVSRCKVSYVYHDTQDNSNNRCVV